MEHVNLDLLRLKIEATWKKLRLVKENDDAMLPLTPGKEEFTEMASAIAADILIKLRQAGIKPSVQEFIMRICLDNIMRNEIDNVWKR